MITPAEIQAKADKLYSKFVRACLNGDEFFPHDLRSDKTLSGDYSQDTESVQALRNGSKEVRGFGYSVEWTQRRVRATGRNEVPNRVTFETKADFLRLIGRTNNFDAFFAAVEKVRATFPQLEAWIRSNVKLLTESADIVDDVILVTQWFQENPRPNCFAREIPVAVHGKFIEQNCGMLQQWFDTEGMLDAHAIRADEKNFYRRYWLRDWEPLITLRCLDVKLQQRFGMPCAEAALPLAQVNGVTLEGVRIFVVENMTNLRTFPIVPNAIVIFGMGNAVVNLRDVECWRNNEVIYWGDLDVFGLRILSQFRQFVCDARSLFMDIQTLRQFRHLMQSPQKDYKSQSLPALLSVSEEEAFHECNESKLQLEQERIPHQAVIDAITTLNRNFRDDC